MLMSLTVLLGTLPAAAQTTPAKARDALHRAVVFMHMHIATQGGYNWVASGDGKLRMGEGWAGMTKAWVQPPGTPSIGQAFLDAYDATGDPAALAAARDAAHALVHGQLQSGGWHYHIDFAESTRLAYRLSKRGDAVDKSDDGVGGWQQWSKRRNRYNVSQLDDDTTQAALRFLIRYDQAVKSKDKSVHAALRYGLDALLGTQYANGGWSANFDRFPKSPPNTSHYPPLAASYPNTWSRTWTNDWTGCYVLNDDIVADAIDTLLAAHRAYDDPRYLAGAQLAGAFLIRAQMPDPQPAWAQQYDRHMHPVWSRKFEPPAICGHESQTAMRALLTLYRATGDKTFLKPVPRAIAYFRKSELPGGKLARFYELKTNRPLYFKRTGNRYDLTYSDDELPDHYGFIQDSRIDAIEAEYKHLLARGHDAPQEVGKVSAQDAARIITAMDDRGAWVERGIMRNAEGRKVEPESGIILSKTFIRNVERLSRYVKQSRR